MNAKLMCTMALLASFGVLGCAEEEQELAGDVMPGAMVNVTLQEYQVTVGPTSAAAGPITFSIYNQGTETHEFEVVKTDLAIADLPTHGDGSFDDEGEGVDVIDEIEAVPAGSTMELAVSLEPGAYVLLCNIVVTEGEETESHFHEGMHAPFMAQ